MLTVHILASGSEGNCLLVSAGGTHLLVDAGISARRICGALQALALSPADISGVLLTHEHTDHICGVATLTKQHRLPLYASRGTAEALCRKSSCVSDVLRVIPRAGAFDIGNARITVFPTSHDATESIDFRVDHDGASIGILTDTGFVTPEAEQTLAGVDLMVLESNHDEEWLLSGPYPYYLKQRILGARGHLSNAAAGAFARRLAEGGTRQFVLAHLSRENNTPERARQTLERALAGLDAAVTVAPRSELSGPYTAEVCVCRLKEKFYIDAAAEYVKRLQRSCKLDIVELPEYRLPEEPSPAEIQKALQAEGAAIRERLPKGGAVVALCIEGKPCSSEELSRRMADFGVQGKTQITFLIGGSVGLSEDVKKLADWRLSMSPMTFPHHMARIMLLEQLYRAYQIAAGTKYHK